MHVHHAYIRKITIIALRQKREYDPLQIQMSKNAKIIIKIWSVLYMGLALLMINKNINLRGVQGNVATRCIAGRNSTGGCAAAVVKLEVEKWYDQ